MLPTPVLSVSGKGFARLRISAWHFSPAPPILYAVRVIVYHKSRVLSRVLRDFSGGKAPGTLGAEPQRHWLDLPRGRGPSQTPKFLSPGPPLSLAAGTARREPLPVVFAANRGFLPPGTCLASSVRAANGLMQGCRGRSPLHKKTLILPLPRRGRALCERGRGDRGQKRR